MKNRQGKTVKERLTEEMQQLHSIKDKNHREIIALKTLGAVDLAVEFNLITYKEWEQYIDNIFKHIA